MSPDNPTVPEASPGDIIELRILTMSDEEWERYLAQRADDQVVRTREDGTLEIVAEDLKALDAELRRKFGGVKNG